MPTCPTCNAIIPEDDINVSEGVALCRACDALHRVSRLLDDGSEVGAIDLQSPPPGTWLINDINGWRAGANFRGPFLYIVSLFTLVWAGGSMTGIYIGPLIRGRLDLDQALFGIPFLIGSVVLISITTYIWSGRAEITQRGARIEVAYGGIFYTRRWDFAGDEATAVRLTDSGVRTNGQPEHNIAIDGPGVEFGGLFLNAKKRAFLVAVLRERVLHRHRS